MKTIHKNLFLWVIAVAITLLSAVFQRLTGPTYPVRGKVEVEGEMIRYRLVRSYTTGKDATVVVSASNHRLKGYVVYKKYKTENPWDTTALVFENGKYSAGIPHQPPAGKIIYYTYLLDNQNPVLLSGKPAVIRFKGNVPAYVLIPHVLFMFLAMLLSNRAGLSAIFNHNGMARFSLITLIFLFAGGLILGPVVQKFAFGAFWTGWPFGHDLTDNKTLVAFLVWAVATWSAIKERKNATYWVIAASVVLLLIYLIPHSMWGSELDHATGTITTGSSN